MKTTLSLKKPLSFEQQAKIFQMVGVSFEPQQKKQQVNSLIIAKKIKRNNLYKTIAWLVKTYPQCFNPKNPKPLKKRIFQDILDQGLWEGSKTSLKAALTFYVGSPCYHKTLLQEVIRYDLEGNGIEEITDSEKEFSIQRLKILKNKRDSEKMEKFENKKKQN